jgi:RHS repeat-associated protein
LPSTLTHHHTVKQSRKTFSGRYSAYRSNRTPLKKSIPIKSPPNPLFAKRGKKNEYDEAKTRVIKHNESTGKITQYINDLFDIEDGEEKIYFFSGDLKLATLDGSSEVGGGETTCTIPTSGNWTITQDCTIATFETAPADVTITAGTTLTIASTGILEVDLNNNSITIEDTGGILVENGGSLAQTNLLTPPQGGGQSTPTLSFHHSDHLSGASVDTDINGDILQITDYYPYGDSRIEDTTSDFHNDYTYTGKERDEDTDLLYYEARYYNSNIGRFISLDPWSGDITDPQSLNKYAYVRNNPLKYVDPDGRVFGIEEHKQYFDRNYPEVTQRFNREAKEFVNSSKKAAVQSGFTFLAIGGVVALSRVNPTVTLRVIEAVDLGQGMYDAYTSIDQSVSDYLSGNISQDQLQGNVIEKSLLLSMDIAPQLSEVLSVQLVQDIILEAMQRYTGFLLDSRVDSDQDDKNIDSGDNDTDSTSNNQNDSDDDEEDDSDE